MNLASPRSLFFLAFLACAAMLGAGFYLQYVVGLEPCPLCIVQRIFFAGAGLFSLIAALHGRGRRVYSVLVLLCSLGGAGTAGPLDHRSPGPAGAPPRRARAAVGGLVPVHRHARRSTGESTRTRPCCPRAGASTLVLSWR